MPKDTSMQVVELLHGSTPSIDAAAILRRASELVPNVELLGPSKDGRTLLFAHPMYVTHLEDGNLPAQTLLAPAHKPFDRANYVEELRQSWSCPDASSLIDGMTSVTLVSELFARTLAASDRVMLFHGVLQAVVELTRPVALVFLHSQQIVSAATYLSDCDNPPVDRRGTINVRFFRIEESDDMIMDTRGLHEVGVHDLQCHFRKLDPNDVSGKLRAVGAYLVENGAVIESGETVDGLAEGEQWVCQFEEGILPPHRDLLDLNPGRKFAAGKRRG